AARTGRGRMRGIGRGFLRCVGTARHRSPGPATIAYRRVLARASKSITSAPLSTSSPRSYAASISAMRRRKSTCGGSGSTSSSSSATAAAASRAHSPWGPGAAAAADPTGPPAFASVPDASTRITTSFGCHASEVLRRTTQIPMNEPYASVVQAGEGAGTLEDRVEHVGRQRPREGVLLAHVVRAQDRARRAHPAARHVDLQPVPEPWARPHAEQRGDDLVAELPERDD